MIEEENKSTASLNLSTSSRSYKPGLLKSKSIYYEKQPAGPSIPQSKSMVQDQPIPMNTPYLFPPQGSSMYPPSNLNMFPKGSGEQQMYPSQMNYRIGGMNQPPFYSSQPQPPPPPQAPPIYGPSQMIRKPAEVVPSPLNHTLPVQTLITPTHPTSTPTSSKITSGSQSPPINDLKRASGKLKFFNQQHQYGFLVSEKDNSDIFFHYDDVKHTQLPKEFLRHATENYEVRFTFQVLDYVGKYDSSKKAVNVNLMSIIAKTDQLD